MSRPMKRMWAGASLGLAILAGCDPNPNGPTFPDKPAAQAGDDEANAPGGPGAKKGRKPGPATLINDPAK